MSKSPKPESKLVRIEDYVSPTEAAAIIGCTDGRVYQLLRTTDEFKGATLPIGKNRVLILRKRVEKIANSPAKTGRPRKCLAS